MTATNVSEVLKNGRRGLRLKENGGILARLEAGSEPLNDDKEILGGYAGLLSELLQPGTCSVLIKFAEAIHECFDGRMLTKGFNLVELNKTVWDALAYLYRRTECRPSKRRLTQARKFIVWLTTCIDEIPCPLSKKEAPPWEETRSPNEMYADLLRELVEPGTHPDDSFLAKAIHKHFDDEMLAEGFDVVELNKTMCELLASSSDSRNEKPNEERLMQLEKFAPWIADRIDDLRKNNPSSLFE